MLPIKTKRLILREWEMEDAAAVQEYAKDPKVVKYMIWGPNTLTDTKIFLRKCVKEQSMKNRIVFNFAVVLKKENKLIGGGRISIENLQNKRGIIGYVLNSKYWGHGYATEAAKALIKFGFEKQKLHRIAAICRPQNKASARVMQKAGMKYESHFREHVFEKGKWHDSLGYAIVNLKS